MSATNDFYSLLREALALAREAGLGQEADALEARAFSAFTTGSEAAAEIGMAILAFRTEVGRRLPPQAALRLDACQAELGKIWPRLRPGWRGALRRWLGRWGIG